MPQRQARCGLASAAAGLTPWVALPQEWPPLVLGLSEGVYSTAILDTLPGKNPLMKLTASRVS